MDNLQPGQMLGGYQILSQIGEGGMATVYKAYQPGMDRNVAIKILPNRLAESNEFAGRFKQEARIIGNLEHPHILPVFDSGEEKGISYLVMRYLEAGTLKEKMGRGPLSWETIDLIFLQLADALGYAHSRGVVHRDLKPSNVLIDSRDNLFLTDFGIAKILEGDSHFTQTDAIMGTPAYISPEQAQGNQVDQRSDIYSLGIILYEMTTGRVPFVADTPLAVIFKHVQDPLPLPSAMRADIPQLIEQVILKALSKKAEDRFQTVEEFAKAWKQARATINQSADAATRVQAPSARSKAKPEDVKKEKISFIGVASLVLIAIIAVVASIVLFKPLAAKNETVEEYFDIEIGDQVSEGEPDDGAGIVESPGSSDIYTFEAEAGEAVFIQINESPDSGDNIQFYMDDEQGFNIFSTCLACGDPGVVTLERGGEYTITVGELEAEDSGYGAYQFILWEVPSPDEFTIEIGEIVSNESYGEGAGYIESPGAQDIYTFMAEAGQDVYFQVNEPPMTSDPIYWSLFDEAGNVLFETCLQCGDPGVIALEHSGIYTLEAGGGTGYGIGEYAFEIWDVQPHQLFEIRIGDTISEDKPGKGAGNIETPGSHDIYSFAVASGDTIVFSAHETTPSGDSIHWRLEDEEENELFNDCLDCGDHQIKFEKPGTYRIIVGTETVAGMGTYEFKITRP